MELTQNFKNRLRIKTQIQLIEKAIKYQNYKQFVINVKHIN